MSAQLQAKVLVVDDDPHVLEMLEDLLAGDYSIVLADSGEKAVTVAEEHGDLAAVVMDIKMAPMDGLVAARKIRELRPQTRVIFHTGYPGEYAEATIDKEEKPFDYIEKGESLPRLLRSVRNAVEAFDIQTYNERLFELAESEFGIIGRSRAMRDVFETIRKVAPTDTKVMILGETGTGKELVAKAIHLQSRRRDKRLGILNCNHKNPDLIESELFGHAKGSFTSATGDRIGLFEYANGGTVFLDEIGDLDMTSQAKLLRVLETGEYTKVGQPQTYTTDVRLICATHRDLEELTRQQRFREDLLYRLKGITITLPSLRDRIEDIPRLVDKFVMDCTSTKSLSPKIFDQSAINALLHHNWPGNVRQLQDQVERLMVLTDSDIILADDVEQSLRTNTPAHSESQSLPQRLKKLERILIIEALSGTCGNIAAAANLLGIDRTTLQKKLKLHDLDADSFRD